MGPKKKGELMPCTKSIVCDLCEFAARPKMGVKKGGKRNAVSNIQRDESRLKKWCVFEPRVTRVNLILSFFVLFSLPVIVAHTSLECFRIVYVEHSSSVTPTSCLFCVGAFSVFFFCFFFVADWCRQWLPLNVIHSQRTSHSRRRNHRTHIVLFGVKCVWIGCEMRETAEKRKYVDMIFHFSTVGCLSLSHTVREQLWLALQMTKKNHETFSHSAPHTLSCITLLSKS